jgi:hypothetical protein
VNRASTGLCGGCRATGIPTATHVGVRASVVRGMPVGIPAWQAKRPLHGAPPTHDLFWTPPPLI